MAENRRGLAASQPLARRDAGQSLQLKHRQLQLARCTWVPCSPVSGICWQHAGHSADLAAARAPLTRGPLSSLQAAEGGGLLSCPRGQGYPHYKGVGQAALQGFQQRRRDRAARASGGVFAWTTPSRHVNASSRLDVLFRGAKFTEAG